MIPTASRFPPRLARAASLLLPAALLGGYALLSLTRRIDADEGYFLYAARLVRQGQIPYRDFFFPQLPLIPYLWGWLPAPIGLDWISARLLAACVAFAAALVFLRLLRLRLAHSGVAIAIFLAYLASDIGLEWATVVKTFAPANLFLLLAWFFGSRHASGLGPPPHLSLSAAWLLSGFFVGLALLTRLTVLPLLVLMPAVMLWEAHRAGRRSARLAILWLVGLLPALIVLALHGRFAPVAFLYDNWHYHSLGDAPDFAARVKGNLAVALEVSLLNPLWLIALLLLGSGLPRRRATLLDWFPRLAFAALFIVSTIPIRAYHQYYCLATPWLLLAAAPELERLWVGAGRSFGLRRRRAALLVCAILLALLAIQPYKALERRWPTWTWRPATAEAAVEFDYRISTVRAVSRRLDELAPPDRPLLTWWPGYALETRAALLGPLANHFALRVGRYEPNNGLARRGGILRTATADDVARAIARREPGAVVVGLWAGQESWVPREAIELQLIESGYAYQESIGSAAIYLPRARE